MVKLFKVTGLVLLIASFVMVRRCLIPSYFLLGGRNNLCDGVSVMCSEPLTNKFYSGAELFPAAESVYKHCWRLSR